MPRSSAAGVFARMPEAFVSDTAISREVSRALKAGRLRKLASRLYTRNLTDPPAAVVRRNLWTLVAGYFPDALVADRTALENAPAEDGSVCLITRRGRNVRLPGITLRSRRGVGPISSDRCSRRCTGRSGGIRRSPVRRPTGERSRWRPSRSSTRISPISSRGRSSRSRRRPASSSAVSFRPSGPGTPTTCWGHGASSPTPPRCAASPRTLRRSSVSSRNGTGRSWSAVSRCGLRGPSLRGRQRAHRADHDECRAGGRR